MQINSSVNAYPSNNIMRQYYYWAKKNVTKLICKVFLSFKINLSLGGLHYLLHNIEMYTGYDLMEMSFFTYTKI